MIKKTTFISVTLPLILWTAVMVLMSSIPGKKLPEVHLFQVDKLAHCAEFFIFSILLARYLFVVKTFSIPKTLKFCLLFSLAYAGLDEIHQLWIPNRCCAWQDFVADSLGIIIGIGCSHFYLKRYVEV